MVGGINGFNVLSCAPPVDPVTTSSPSFKFSAVTAVLTPSLVPGFTSTGRTYWPLFSQITPVAAVLPSDGGSSFWEPASGEIWASDDGDHRSAALGTSRASDSFSTMKRTFAVRYGSSTLSELSIFTS